MKFLLKEAIKSISVSRVKKKVGFVVPSIGFYDKVSASTRIRVYDIIDAFNTDPEFHLELYRSFRHYDIVCFLKTYDAPAQLLAKKLQTQGTRVVFDININIFEAGSSSVSDQQRQDGNCFAGISDAIITNSPHTQALLREQFVDKTIRLIREVISDSYFNVKKGKTSSVFTLLWVGYAHKADALSLIKNVLNQLHKTITLKIIIIAEKQPDLSLLTVPVEFRTYNHDRITEDLAEADVFVAPRDLTDPYNLGHSFTKVGIAMAAGIPVVASPVPSYTASPALCCSGEEDWSKTLTRLYTDTEFRNNLISKGKQYCAAEYGLPSIKSHYNKLFADLLTQSIDS